MVIKNSVRLFSDYRALNRWFRNLDLMMHHVCDAYRDAGEPMTAEGLTEALVDEFRLFHVWLDHPVDVAVDVLPTVFRTSDGEHHRRYLAQLRIPWRGSKLLLRTAPEPDFRFPYRGRIGKRTVRLLDLLPDHDATAFVADAVEQVNIVREALTRSSSAVHAYNDRIDAAIARKVRTY